MPTLGEYIRQNRALGLDDRAVQAKFRREYGFSPMNVDPIAELPPTLAQQATVPAPTQMTTPATPVAMDPLRQQAMEQAGVTRPPTSEEIGQSVGGMAGAAVGAAKVLGPVAASALGIQTPWDAQSAQAIWDAAQSVVATKEGRRDQSLYESAMESAKDMFAGPGMLYYTAARTAAGLPPVGYRGPYSMAGAYNLRQQTGSQVAGGLIGGPVGMGVAALPLKPQPGRQQAAKAFNAFAQGETPQVGPRNMAAGPVQFAPGETAAALGADPFGYGAALLPTALAATRRLRGATPAAEWVKPASKESVADFRKQLDAQVQQGRIAASDVDDLVAERFPPRRSVKAEPAPKLSISDKVAGGVMRGLIGAAMGDWISPAVTAAAAVAGPAAFKKIVGKLSPRTQKLVQEAVYRVKRGLGERWWLMPDEAQTEITRLITRAGPEAQSEIGFAFREFANRVKRGEAGLDPKAEPVKLPSAEVEAMEVLPTGELALESGALRRAGEAAEWVKAGTEEAAGARAAERILRKKERAGKAPYMEQSRELLQMAQNEAGLGAAARKQALEEVARVKPQTQALKERARAQMQIEGKQRLAARSVVEGRREATAEAAGSARSVQEAIQLDRNDLATQAKALRSSAAQLREVAKRTKGTPQSAKMLQLARKQEKAARELRDAAKLSAQYGVAIRGATKKVQQALRTETKMARKGGSEAVSKYLALAKQAASTADDLRSLADDLKDTSIRAAQPARDAANMHYQVAKSLREQAKELRKQGREAVADISAGRKEARDQGEFLETLLDDDDLYTREKREAEAGLRTTETDRAGIIETIGGKGIVERAHAAFNKAAPPGKGIKLDTVKRRMSDALQDEGLSLLMEPGVRGKIYTDLAKKVSKDVADKFMSALDDKMVELSRPSISQAPRSMTIKMPDGSTVDLRKLIGIAVRDFAKTDPKRLREWRANAIERVGVSLGSMASKRISALELMNEAYRFTDINKKGKHDVQQIGRAEIQKILDEGEARPVVTLPAIAQQLDPTGKMYETAPPWLRTFVKDNANRQLPEGAVVDKNAMPILKAMVDTHNILDSTSALVQAGRHVSLTQTAYRAATHKGNVAGNTVFESVATGKGPAAISGEMAKAAEWYTKSVRGKKGGADLMEWRAYAKSGAFSTSIIDDTLGTLFANAKTAGKLQTLEKAGKVAKRIYQAEDTLFKLMSARRNYKANMERLRQLSDGRSIEFQMRDKRWVRVDKKGDKLYLRGKEVVGQDLADLVGNTSTVPGLGRYFDYTGGGLWRKKMGIAGARTPLTSWLSAYYSWPYFATDIPGVKRGLLTNIFDDAGGGYWRTNDPGLIKEGVATAAKIGLRRAAMVQAGLNLTRPERHDIMSDLGFRRTAPVIQLAFPTGRGEEVDIIDFRQEYAGQATEMLWRAAHGGMAMIAGGDWMKDKRVGEAAKMFPGIDFTTNMKKMRRIWALHQRGDIISGEDALAIMGYGGPLIERVYDELTKTGPDGKPLPVNWDKVAVEVSKLMLGGSPVAMAQYLEGLRDPTSPYSKRRYEPTTGELEDSMSHLFRMMLSAGAKTVNIEEELGRKLDERMRFLENSLMQRDKRRLKRLERAKGPKAEAERKRLDAKLKVFGNALRRAARSLSSKMKDQVRKSTRRRNEKGRKNSAVR